MFENAIYNPIYKGYAILISFSEYALMYENIQDAADFIPNIWDNLYEIHCFDNCGIIRLSKEFNERAYKHKYALLSCDLDNLDETIAYIKIKWGKVLPQNFDYDNRICYFIGHDYYNGDRFNDD